MKKKALYISRQLLLGVIALQFLNLSVGSQAYWEGDYDYSYTYNKSYDPTETAVEWIIEMKYGQQTRFSYDNHTDTNKNLSKTFHWKTDLREALLPPPPVPASPVAYIDLPTGQIPSHPDEILSPPPESRRL